MNTTYEVRFWEIRVLKSGKRRYGVRWVTGTERHSKYFENKAHAKSRLSELMQAARSGEAFDIESGLPISELKQRDSVSLVTFAQSYMDMKWPNSAAKTRASTVDGLATVAAVFVKDAAGRPELRDMRRALTGVLIPPVTRGNEVSAEQRSVIDWILRQSRPVHDFTDPKLVRSVLDALAVRLDGGVSAATVYQRKRAVLFNLLSYAVEEEILPDNPLTRIKRKADKVVGEVDPRVVANPDQVSRLLIAATYVGARVRERGEHLRSFYATLYYAAARPAEALALRETDCTLPETGWGQLALGESRPAAGKRWTDSGEVHDRRGLKHRGTKEVRFVPIPPMLVAILREHLDRFGTAPDGRLFRAPNGGMVSSSSYRNTWARARTYAFTPAQVASPLARRPYDLRHAAVSLWLNGGVPPTEVAERAGQSVDVLLRVYAKCVDGQREAINQTIEGLY
ncbi:integrase [Actinocrispum sp. NPDC049592]|uniref:tyrosine-type recombinase/integrase n=1 Tax=Actinocrispum sp. NPDC049592 TaxID=3154835 RepID=UPI003432114F